MLTIQGFYRVARRAALERIYTTKEYLLARYDRAVAILTCKRRIVIIVIIVMIVIVVLIVIVVII